MADPRVEKLAQILVDHSARIKPGDRVAIEATTAAEPLVRALYGLILERGGQPSLLLDLTDQDEILFNHASDEQLEIIPPFRKMAYDQFESRIRIGSATNPRALSNVEPARQKRRQRALAPILEAQMRRGAEGAFKWVSTLFPTEGYAMEAECSLRDLEDFVYSACLCDLDDPVAAWREVDRKQQILVDYLKEKSEIHLVGEDTDVKVGIAGRTFVNCSGDKNMPDGEVFTGPEETRVNGHVRFSFPAIYQSREVSDVRVWFEDGVAVRWSAAKNEDLLTQMLMTDEGSRRLGEFAFGTNFGIQRFIKNILFDEKIGGTFHMAFGGGYPETGSQNRSAIHWDMICDLRRGSEVRVDGELFAKDGKYLLWEKEN